MSEPAGHTEKTSPIGHDRHEDERRSAEAILGAMRHPMLVLNRDLRVETVNAAFCRTFEVSDEATAGLLIYELGNGQWNIPKLRELLEAIVPLNGQVDNFRVEHKFERIGPRVMLLNAHRIERTQRREAILVAIEDVTEFEDARTCLQREKEYVENIIGSSREALVTLDLDLRVKAANDTFYKKFRVGPSDTVGRKVYDLGNGQWDIPRLRYLLETVLPEHNTFENYEIEHDFVDLGHRTMVLNARRVDQIELIILAFEDQTAVRRADRAIAESEQRLRKVLDNLAAFVGLLTPDGIVLEANRAPLEAAGIALSDVKGRRFEDCYWWSYSTAVQAQLRAAIARAAEGELVRYDVEIQAAYGRRTIDFMLAPLRDDAGALIGLIPSGVDITERKQAEESLRAAKKAAEAANVLKSRFVAATSHDLRQPLQTIGLLGAALAQPMGDDESQKILEKISQTVTTMSEILDSLLDIDRLDTGQIQPEISNFPVQRLLARLRSQFSYVAESRGLDLRFISSSAIVRSDAQLLERLVGNLVSNAIKYSASGGRVLIGGRLCGDSLRIEVFDTGVGIPEDQLERIFVEYYRLDPASGGVREPGLGLGLALVRRLSELLGHRVLVRSTPRGSMFAVEVPLAQARLGRGALRAGPSGEGAPDHRAKVSVLLVDDETGPRESLRLLLDLHGYDVLAVATASEALAIEAHRFPPSLVIADYQLGQGMTGVELIRSLREAKGWTFPSIVLTGDSSRETRHEIENAKCRYELKPVRPDQLLKVVGQLVGHEARTAPSKWAPEPQVPTPAAKPAGSTERTVFVVEDDPEVRMAGRLLLEAAGHQVEDFATGEAFLQSPGALARHGCVVLDIGLPGMSGLLVQERLKAGGAKLSVVVVTGQSEVSVAVQAMRAGAVDFLEKPFGGDRLLEAVDRALKYAAPSSAAAPVSETSAFATSRFARLTPRERQVIALVADGLLNKQVAYRLGISQRTVENHRARGMQKLGVASLADLVRFAVAAEAGGLQIFSQ